MKKNWKKKISRITGNMRGLDRKILQLKSSWDEVEDILNKSVKKKKKI